MGTNFRNTYPIVIPTLNRFEHFKNCVESLSRCSLADRTELIIGLDYPPSDKYRTGWNSIKEYIPKIIGFKKVTVLESTSNVGAVENCNQLRRYVKKLGYDAFIITEDDNVFAPGFLEYINWGLSYFKDDKSILAICGYKRVEVSFLKNNVYKYPRFVAWGYGMWFDRRDRLETFANFDFLKNYLDHISLLSVFTNKVLFANSVMTMLKKQAIYGDTLPGFLPKEEQYCVFPKHSLVRNEGFDGSGLHNGYSPEAIQRYHKADIDNSEHFEPHIEEPLYHKRLKKIYDKTYGCTFLEYTRAAAKFLIYYFTGKLY